MIRYRIIDRQIHGRYFADGALFNTKEDIRQQLISYHLTDMDNGDTKKFKKFTLDEVLEFGEWDIEEIEINYCPYCKAEFEVSEGHNCDIGRTT